MSGTALVWLAPAAAVVFGYAVGLYLQKRIGTCRGGVEAGTAARLRALQARVRHTRGCQTKYVFADGTPYPCDCGLAALLDSAERTL